MTTSETPDPTTADQAAPPEQVTAPEASPPEQVTAPEPVAAPEASPPDPEPAAETPAEASPPEPEPAAETPADEAAPAEDPAPATATPEAAPAAEAPATEAAPAEDPAPATATPVAEAAPAAEAPAASVPAPTIGQSAPAPTIGQSAPAPTIGQSAAAPGTDGAPPASDAAVDDVDPDAGLGLPAAGAILGPPNLGGFESGEILTGTVLTVEKREAEIDLGDGKIGVVGERHWSSEQQIDLTTVMKPGDTVEAAVLARADIKKRITLSRLWAQQKRGWEAAEAAAKDKSDLEATVTETVKGGLSLDVNGLRGFMPASLVDVQTVNDLSPYIGQTFAVRVIEADRNKARLIVSRKAAMRATQRQQAKAALGGIKVGQTMTGIVAQITDFGAFVDVKGVRGLVHKSEIGWSRARDPQRDLKVGQEVEVKVLKVQPSRNRLGLSMRTENDPLKQVRKGERFEATVTRLVDFGAFVSLPSGVEGLVHVSEMAEYRVFAPEEIVIPGEKVWVKVIKVDKKRRTIDLSMAQAVAPDPAEEIAAREAAAAAAEAKKAEAKAKADAAPAETEAPAEAQAPATPEATAETEAPANESEAPAETEAPATPEATAEAAAPATPEATADAATSDAAPATDDDHAEDAAETPTATTEEE